MSRLRILAIDLGTSGCKAGIFEDGVLTATAAEPVTTDRQATGWAEQDAEAWWSILVGLVRVVHGQVGGAPIDAIAIVGQSDSLVALDTAGRPVHPCILWMDGRGADDLRRAVDAMGMDAIRRRTGLRPGLNFTAPKAAWLARNRPDAYARTAWLVQPKDALVARMTGRVVTDPSSASRTLLYDIDAGRWSPELVSAFGLDLDRLPPVVASGAEAGRLTSEAATELGLSAGIVIAAGAADRAAEALGVGLGGTDTMVSTGTATGIVRSFRQGLAVADSAVILPAHAIEGRRLAILSQPTSGTVLDWFAGLASPNAVGGDLETAASESPPGANGVIVVPFFMGARSIRWDPSARGAIHGLTLATGRGDIARAIVEGVAMEVQACRTRLDVMCGPTERLILAGGAHRSALWSQIVVDVTGTPGVRYADPDASLVGAILLASQAIGAVTDLASAATERLTTSVTYLPDADRHAAYRDVIARYDALLPDVGMYDYRT